MSMMKLNELKTAWAGKTCLCFDTLSSTQEYGRCLAKKESVHGTLITAETQTAGKGRRGRSWQSPKGTTIAMTLCLEPKISTEHLSGLTLVMALAAAEAIRETAGVVPQIKWPNDIVVNGRKVCGILTELFFEKGRPVVLIGTGINVNTEEFPEEIREIAGSLKSETGKEITREALIASAMKYFEKFYEQYEKTENLSLLKEAYEALLANKGKQVQVLDPQQPYQGTAKGITHRGDLIVVREDGTTWEVSSGEVSVRGLYGYV